MRVPSIVGAISAIVLAAALGCGPKTNGAFDEGTAPEYPCTILSPSSAVRDTIRVALFNSVDLNHAPIPRNDAERLVFSHLYDDAFAPECQSVSKGAYRVALATKYAIVIVPSSDPTLAVIKFVDFQGHDPRDLIDGSSIDVMLVESRSVATYAERQERYRVTPLPVATKAYVLVSVTRASAFHDGELLPLPASLTRELASEAVRDVHAEPIGNEAWWFDLEACNSDAENIPNGYEDAEGRIAYDESDPVARDLAERIVSLALSNSPNATALKAALPKLANRRYGLAVAGLTRDELERRLSWGYAEVAFVLALPADVMDRCRAADQLISAAPWLGGRPTLSKMLLPLVKTRSIAIVLNRRYGAQGNCAGLSCDRLGNVRIYGWKELDSVP